MSKLQPFLDLLRSAPSGASNGTFIALNGLYRSLALEIASSVPRNGNREAAIKSLIASYADAAAAISAGDDQT